MRLPRRIALVTLLAGLLAFGSTFQAQGPERSDTTFKSTVEVVTISAVVRDRAGRLVTHLTANDFEVVDSGVPRRIVGFRSDPGPISIAVLFDISGSMDSSIKLPRARDAAHQILSWLDASTDEVALFTFDTTLEQLRDFGRPSPELTKVIATLRPFGATSLRDAIAAAAKRVIGRDRGARRSVVVLSDGVDTASRMTTAEVSGAASAIDVPVYILATVSPVDHAGGKFAVDGVADAISSELSNLARWTGGEFFMASVPAHVSLAVRQIVGELRQQYLIAVEPGEGAGWHRLEVRTRDRRLTVRARSGYFAAGSARVQ